MTKIQHILGEIEQLEPQELEYLLNELVKKVNEVRNLDTLFDEYIGIGEGIWKSDAQEFVNELRDEERGERASE